MNELAGKEFRYLIGSDNPGFGSDTAITEVGYDVTAPVKHGISVAYCNLFDEKNTGKLGPYLHNSDTAQEYNEGQIDPEGPGFFVNLNNQFRQRRDQGFKYVELDNPDAYDIKYVLQAIDYAQVYDLKVLAKNPGLFTNHEAIQYLSHPNVYGMIVEKDCGLPAIMDLLRTEAGKPDLPTWFVSFGHAGRNWLYRMDDLIKKGKYKEMSAYLSTKGEYGNSIPLL